MHDHNILHRDLKPDNLMLGDNWNNSNQIFMIDFGLAKRWKNDETGEHIPFYENVGTCGTLRYESTYSMKAMTKSRRDDLISIGYMLIYFLKGSLPW